MNATLEGRRPSIISPTAESAPPSALPPLMMSLPLVPLMISSQLILSPFPDSGDRRGQAQAFSVRNGQKMLGLDSPALPLQRSRLSPPNRERGECSTRPDLFCPNERLTRLVSAVQTLESYLIILGESPSISPAAKRPACSLGIGSVYPQRL